jgi:hypothetical protein
MTKHSLIAPAFSVDVIAAVAYASLPTFAESPSRLSYEIANLGTLGGAQSFALDINNRAEITGNAAASTHQRARSDRRGIVDQRGRACV